MIFCKDCNLCDAGQCGLNDIHLGIKFRQSNRQEHREAQTHQRTDNEAPAQCHHQIFGEFDVAYADAINHEANEDQCERCSDAAHVFRCAHDGRGHMPVEQKQNNRQQEAAQRGREDPFDGRQ